MKFTFAPESRPLDGYTIKRAIYRGGFGEVYYALTDAGREVALKLLQNNSEVELRGVQQCLNLSHPNLVTIFDVKQDRDGDHWIVMEYVAGETLDAAIHRYPSGMPMEEVRGWLRGMTDGVAFLHNHGLVHRDLKPGNVFSDGNVVKIGDIGLSKFITPSRRSAQTQSVGTVYYMAPEVAKGRYGREVDVYALGIILYEMVTGRVPFDGESTGEILMKHLSERPNLEPLPPRLRPVIDMALQKDPAKRFASVQDLRAAFEAAVIGKPFTAGDHVRVVVEDARSVESPGYARVDHSDMHTLVDGDDRTTSIWWPTRRAFWLIWGAGLLMPIITDERGHSGAGVALIGSYSCYIAYTLLRRTQAKWTRPLLEFFDRSSRPMVGRVMGRIVGRLFFLVASIARVDAGYFIEVAIPTTLGMFFAGLLLHLVMPKLRRVYAWESRYFGRRSPQQASVKTYSIPEPVPPQPVRQEPRFVQPVAAQRYYRHRKTTPSVLRGISWRTRMMQYSTAGTVVVPIIALLTGSVAALSPEFFALGSTYGAGWENVGLFAATAVLASWMLMALSKWNEGRRLDGATRRLLQLAGGAAVGLAAFWISELLLISPTPTSEVVAGTLWSQPAGAVFSNVADRPLFVEGGRPSLLGFVAFFATVFGLRRWWWQADAFRPKRFRVGSVVLSVLLAWIVASVWSFPMVWAMTWAAVISSAVQLASVWTPPDERLAAREV